jgi:Zn-finger nucleic acid-binding protein
MQCPARDAELTNHTAQGENGLTVSYSICPICRGYWMDSFSANYIKTNIVGATRAIASTAAYYCPVCGKTLQRTTGDNIPDGVFIFDCPAHHGYFFPTGQLAAFKHAQQTKIEYHKLWHIPVPNVSSILLGSIVLLLAAGGLALTFRGLQERQTMESQAQQILIGHAVYTAADHTTILVTATTNMDAALTIHIPALNNFTAPMQSENRRTHQLTIPNVQVGTYRYFFTIQISGKKIESDTFIFTNPQP